LVERFAVCWSEYQLLNFQTNQLVLWLYPPKEDDAGVYPCAIGTRPHDGDITELKVLHRRFITSFNHYHNVFVIDKPQHLLF
jgi:hypothetical protein